MTEKVNWKKVLIRKTDWYSGTVKPVREGEYERDYVVQIKKCLWQDSVWWVWNVHAKEWVVSMHKSPLGAG